MRPPTTTRPHRAGFTLVELLVVIVILGVLVGLLVPAVMRAVATAKEAQVSAEIQAMAQALAQFKSQFNEYPPSRIVISETGDYTSSTLNSGPVPLANLGPRTMTVLRRYWPRVQFNTTSPGNPANGLGVNKFYDVNGNGVIDKIPYMLQGPECLVFFLGGIPQLSGNNTWSMSGFSKDPTNPFQPQYASTGTGNVSTNRTTPLYEFNNSRLVANSTNLAGPPGGFPGYLDPLGAGSGDAGLLPFYAYFSAYSGQGYDPDDVNMAEPDPAGAYTAIMGAFTTGNAPLPSKVYGPNVVASPAPNPYTNDVPVATTTSGNYAPPGSGGTKPRPWQNPTSFQIISPGRDRYYGIGGQWVNNGTVRLPFVNVTGGYAADSMQTMQANADVTGQMLGPDVRNREQDNLTNFAQGRLD